MAKDPAFLFYSADFLTGTIFMTNEEIGKYIKILCLLHQHGGKLPVEKLEKAVGELTQNIVEKLEFDDKGNLFSSRLLLETKKRQDYCESRRKNIKHRYVDTYEPTYVETMKHHMENENENINKDINTNKNTISVDKFEGIWTLYPKREGKKEALRHFKASVHNEKDLEDMQKALKNYINYIKSQKTEIQYVKNGATWFNNWRDYVDFKPEIPKNNPPQPAYKAPDEKERFKFVPEVNSLLKTLAEKKGVI